MSRFLLAASLVVAVFSPHAGAQAAREAWRGFAKAGFSTDVDAALDWGRVKVYFFRGPNYLRYDVAAESVDDGYPKPIAGNWNGLDRGGFDKGIDAVINWGNGKIFFFRGPNYLRYDISADRVDDGFPKPIAGNWNGLDRAGFDKGVRAPVNWGNGKVFFFRGPDYVRFDIDVDTGSKARRFSHARLGDLVRAARPDVRSLGAQPWFHL